MANGQGKRRYERIEVELHCRLFIPERQGDGLRMQAFGISHNLGLGGLFVESTFLFKPGLNLYVELHLPDEALAVEARIAHVVALGTEGFPSGMGIEFLNVSSAARESLLRYFTPLRYTEFYQGLLREFPHLDQSFDQPAVSLILNLWEEWKNVSEGGVPFTDSGAPGPPPLRARGARKKRSR